MLGVLEKAGMLTAAARVLSRTTVASLVGGHARHATQSRCFAQHTTGSGPPLVSSLRQIRAVVKMKGADTWNFLQGLVTNDVTKLRDAEGPSVMYAALLNPQGRFLHDLLLHKQNDASAVWLDIEKEKATELIKLLQRYKLRSEVELLNVSDSYTVWANLGGGGPAGDGWLSDPRLPQLGRRAILPAEEVPAGELLSDEHYTALRFGLGVGEGSVEIPGGAALPLEYNLDGLNGVSYVKGCYVGQELTARTHFQGVIRKRLMPILMPEGAGGRVKAGDKISAGQGGGRAAGTVNAVLGSGAGLALMRLQTAARAVAGEVQLTVGDVPVTPVVPEWWPAEWMASANDVPQHAE